MTEAPVSQAQVTQELNLFKSLDLKVYNGFMQLMSALRQEGFEEEFSNGMVLKKLHEVSSAVNPIGAAVIRTFCCYTVDGGQALKALRIELRHPVNPILGRNVIIRPDRNACLAVVG